MIRPCEVCKNDFTANKVKTRFCSGGCRKRWYRAHATKSEHGIPTPTVGAFAEMLVAADLMGKGCHVFRSLSPSCPCDLLLIDLGKVVRVEVTTGARSPSGTLTYPKKDLTKSDILAVYVRGEGILYFPESTQKNRLA